MDFGPKVSTNEISVSIKLEFHFNQPEFGKSLYLFYYAKGKFIAAPIPDRLKLEYQYHYLENEYRYLYKSILYLIAN